MAHGCANCKTIFMTQVLLCLGDHPPDYRCPVCGSLTTELGPLPRMTNEDGEFYLVDSNRAQGPYPTATAAQLDLWSWYGGRPDGNRLEEGRQEVRAQEDYQEEGYEERAEEWERRGVLLPGGDA